MERLKTNDFQRLYELSSSWPQVLRFLWLGFLVYLEERFIDVKTEAAIDQAIKEYEDKEDPVLVVSEPIYSESGSDFFDEMRLTAPWVSKNDN
jgi:hypothetical protein